ncbi:MAG TPA: pyridoxamine 5'-phosphate oxidase family protein [Nocardioidaceae bacterium]|jgi:nitroimidazol reductase NimA-like FMN-containing flavoprotein (pyridoxamine 5'-phosphate oxidase superfamily)|nr:pyridoxamine 5'-phosphate oxidase family protein [Nocardioidaceae bacterium]
MSDMIELSPAECQEHLERGGVGRLAFNTPQGLRIVPLNYTTNGNAVVFRTVPGSELGTYGAGAEAVFEIDEIDHDAEEGWSVVAFGRLERPSDEDEVWDIRGWRNPTPWSGEHRNFHLKLRWDAVTGRRIVGRPASS